MASTDVLIRQIQPRGPTLTFKLLGDATFAPAQAGASGGLQIVDRPKRVAATQFFDSAPKSLVLPLLLTGGEGLAPNSVEPQCSIIEGWILPTASTLDLPVLQVRGPVPGGYLFWQLYTFSFGAAIRNSSTGARVQQTVSITLWQYVPVLGSPLIDATPAQTAARTLAQSPNNPTPKSRRYTVRAGDTLASIAARQLGDYRQWTDIATLNGIRDPASISVGQVLVLPS